LSNSHRYSNTQTEQSAVSSHKCTTVTMGVNIFLFSYLQAGSGVFQPLGKHYMHHPR